MKRIDQMETKPIIEGSITGSLAVNEDRTPVTVIGLGPMGQALANAFLKNGNPTTVWNRSANKADDLVRRGAIFANTVIEAVAASPLVIICVLDYTVVHTIIEPVAAALRGRTLVNLTADSPTRSRHMAVWAAEHGVDYLDGAIMTPTSTIGTPAAVVLYSGPEFVFKAVQPILAGLGGTANYLGSDPGRAAAHDVALLDFFWTSMIGFAHAIALAGAENIKAKEFAVFAQGLIVILPGIMTAIANQVDEGRHPGDQSNIISAAAGMEHIIHAAELHGIDISVLSATKAIAQRAIDAGYGTDNFSRLTEFFQ